jgi:tripartite-type tricarboxylate transporter receptor subunit TctC
VNGRSDIAPVAGIARGAFVMVINPSVPAKTIPEFIAYAKANPGKISMASSGTGTTNHVEITETCGGGRWRAHRSARRI